MGGNEMTKQQLKEKYQEWNREITALDTRKNEIFTILQQLNIEHGSGKSWCSISENMKDLINSGYDCYKVYSLIAEYSKIEGKIEALHDLAIKTKNFKID